MFSLFSWLNSHVYLFSSLPPGVVSVHVSLHSELIHVDELYSFLLQSLIEVDVLKLQLETDFQRIRIENLVDSVIRKVEILLHVMSYRVWMRDLSVRQSSH